MARINLRDIYPHYKGDTFVDIPDEILKEIEDYERKEKAYRRYLRYYNVILLSDIEQCNAHEILDISFSPHDVYEQNTISTFLYRAVSQLPDKQAKRIFAHFFLSMSNVDIARAEGVDESSVRESIKSGLRKLKKILNDAF